MINALIPLKIKDDSQYSMFKDCFNSYYQYLQNFDTEYIICDESNNKYSSLIDTFLKESNVNFRYTTNQGNTFYDTISTLIGSLESKYFLFIIDDCELYNKRNILVPIIKALESDASLIQVMLGCSDLLKSIGHYPRCSKKNNLLLHKSHDTATIDNIKFNSLKHNEDIVWTTNLINRDLFNYDPYIFAFWNTIMRSEVFKEWNNVLKTDNRSVKTFHGYAENACFHTPNSIFTKNYNLGWLNFENYIYPHHQAGHGVTKEILFNFTESRENNKQ